GAQRIKGYRPDEIIGKHFSIFYPEADKQSHKPERELEIASRTGVYEEEGWRLRKDGSRFWASVVITAVHDEHGDLRGFAKVTRDITERKRAEETQLALVEQQQGRMQAEDDRRRAEQSYRVAQEANRATADAKSTTRPPSIAPALGTIPADPPRLHQVMWNLLSNAVKFTPKHGVVQVGAQRAASQVQLSVTDTGEGIEPGFLPHV